MDVFPQKFSLTGNIGILAAKLSVGFVNKQFMSR